MGRIDLEPVGWLAAIDAIGLDAEVYFKPRDGDALPPGARAWDDAQVKEAVVTCLAERGLPVLLLVHPRPGFHSLVTGYRDAGSELVGWSVEGGEMHGIRFMPGRQRTFAGWEDHVRAAVIPTAWRARPDPSLRKSACADRRTSLGPGFPDVPIKSPAQSAGLFIAGAGLEP